MRRSLCVATLIAAILNLTTNTCSAQSYSTIDDNLALYCADFPDATNAVVRVEGKNGLYTVNPVDPQAEKSAIIKLRKDIQRRISSLSKIKKNYEPSSDISTLKKSFKFIADDVLTEMESDASLDKVSPAKIYKKISALIAALKLRLSELQTAIETIDRCVNNENLIPPPISASPEIIIFNFTHPDYGTTEIMRGLGISAILHKSRSYASVCIGAAHVSGRIPIFPKEAEFRVNRNPCLSFFQTSFRNYPFCHYGAHQDSAVAWFSYTEPGFSQSPVSSSEMKAFESRLAKISPVHLRFPTKKHPCRG